MGPVEVCGDSAEDLDRLLLGPGIGPEIVRPVVCAARSPAHPRKARLAKGGRQVGMKSAMLTGDKLDKLLGSRPPMNLG